MYHPSLPHDYYAKCLLVIVRVFRASAIYLRALYSWDCVACSPVAGDNLTVHYAELQGSAASRWRRLGFVATGQDKRGDKGEIG
jgi:hypothetical protein